MIDLIGWGLATVCIIAGLPCVMTDYVLGYRHSSAQAAREAPGGCLLLGIGVVLALIMWGLS